MALNRRLSRFRRRFSSLLGLLKRQEAHRVAVNSQIFMTSINAAVNFI